MARKPRRFVRQSGQRSYRKLFLIAAEGSKTEPQYFSLFNSPQATIQVNCLKCGHDSAPPQVLKRMTSWLKKHGLKDSDEAWLVVDKDQWTDAQLKELLHWSQSKENYGFALSNPKFEYQLSSTLHRVDFCPFRTRILGEGRKEHRRRSRGASAKVTRSIAEGRKEHRTRKR